MFVRNLTCSLNRRPERLQSRSGDIDFSVTDRAIA